MRLKFFISLSYRLDSSSVNSSGGRGSAEGRGWVGLASSLRSSCILVERGSLRYLSTLKIARLMVLQVSISLFFMKGPSMSGYSSIQQATILTYICMFLSCSPAESLSPSEYWTRYCTVLIFLKRLRSRHFLKILFSIHLILLLRIFLYLANFFCAISSNSPDSRSRYRLNLNILLFSLLFMFEYLMGLKLSCGGSSSVGLSLCSSQSGIGGRILYSATLRRAGSSQPRMFWRLWGLRLYFSSMASKILRTSSVMVRGSEMLRPSRLHSFSKLPHSVSMDFQNLSAVRRMSARTLQVLQLVIMSLKSSLTSHALWQQLSLSRLMMVEMSMGFLIFSQQSGKTAGSTGCLKISDVFFSISLQIMISSYSSTELRLLLILLLY